ncbi:CNNM family magnesium/cobalt transport protein CorC [Blochmannia endosymbiont of Camponotus (Colobopsis) obliquus]|uniref:CNNM family magnesium/cobalt transport protein CorC n=1 Tax=Blochmannia endosymbiont of Camponotus (Colobopsis) obliquus TaxID=1505597 RepID=UPI00061A5DA5|nr:CNNM family magnesium/cobalt transport protein CorC [Blochmannia endosymbiont of Camponotus (Colobopsis) obliquus]AKC60481.1 magnesium and cobalt efflux protein CorC [Blochmannia endosymbiont of Camponotus (Colobopsis) obliquus]
MSDHHLQENNNLGNKKNFFTTILNQLFHSEPKNRKNLLKLIHNYEQHSLIDTDTRKMLEGVINLTEKKVRDIMIPKSQIITLNKSQTLQHSLDVIIQYAHSRFPIVGENKDHIIGILMVKDLLPFMFNTKHFNIEKIMRPAIVVPENKRVDRMLKEFRCQHYHMSIIIDEFGNMSGLITIEDILELIVGNIEDEYDDEEHYEIHQINQHTFIVHALTPIKKFNKTFNAHFDHEEFDTIGGLIMQSFGHLPKIHESINIDNYIFKVSLTDSRRIIQVLVQIP